MTTFFTTEAEKRIWAAPPPPLGVGWHESWSEVTRAEDEFVARVQTNMEAFAPLMDEVFRVLNNLNAEWE